MESRMTRRRSSAVVLMLNLLMLMTTMISARRIIVGGNQGWSPGVNYTDWVQDTHFYYDDWLFFVYDRNQQSVLEVTKTSYESCNSDQPLHNYTTGAGRDVVHLNVTRSYYFISRKVFCLSGMKLAVSVGKIPPQQSASPTPPPPQVSIPPISPPASSLQIPSPPPPPPHILALPASEPAPTANNAPVSLWTFKSLLVVPVAFALCDSFLTKSI